MSINRCHLMLSGVLLAVLPASGQLIDNRSQQDMEAILATIHAEANDRNIYMGNAQVRSLRLKLKELEPTMNTAPVRYLQTLTQLGNAEVALGNIETGIRHLTAANDLAVRTKVEDSILGEILAALGMAHLRSGETENCCARYSPESCIVPLQGSAIHTDRKGSENAIKLFKQVLQLKQIDPELKYHCAWLTNLAYMTLGEFPSGVPMSIRLPDQTFESRVTIPKFKNKASDLGVDRFNLAGGAILDDFDGDRDLDLIVSSWDPAESLGYYENNGSGSFTERTKEAGVAKLLGGLNLVQADYDNDGDLDFFVMRGAWQDAIGQQPNSLLQNQGKGVFIDRTFEAGLGHKHYPTQTAAWADYDNDGDLDLYVGNESANGLTAPSQLFKNRGDGTFIDVASQAGVTNDRFTKGVVWGDVDGDRWPDIVVSNYEDKNRLYRNNGDGTFTDIAKSAGVEQPSLSFPVWTWDYDNDGLLDIFISSYARKVGDFVKHSIGRPTNTELAGHYRGLGDGTFNNVAKPQGLDVPMMPMGANYGDLNNDGFLDFYLGTGEPRIAVILPNMMFLNNRGRGFFDVTMAGGFGHLQKGHAIAFGDIDNDGDEDIFEQMGGARPVDKYRDALYQNPGFGNHWLKVKLVGKTSNRSAIGARIRAEFVEGNEVRAVYRHVGSGGSFGANPLLQHIGTGRATEIKRLEVFWPTSNTTQVFENVAADQSLEVTEGAEAYRTIQ